MHLARLERAPLAHLTCFMRVVASPSLPKPLPSLAALIGDFVQRCSCSDTDATVAGAAYSALALRRVLTAWWDFESAWVRATANPFPHASAWSSRFTCLQLRRGVGGDERRNHGWCLGKRRVNTPYIVSISSRCMQKCDWLDYAIMHVFQAGRASRRRTNCLSLWWIPSVLTAVRKLDGAGTLQVLSIMLGSKRHCAEFLLRAPFAPSPSSPPRFLRRPHHCGPCHIAATPLDLYICWPLVCAGSRPPIVGIVKCRSPRLYQNLLRRDRNLRDQLNSP